MHNFPGRDEGISFFFFFFENSVNIGEGHFTLDLEELLRNLKLNS